MTLMGDATREDVEAAELAGGKVYVGNIRRDGVKPEDLMTDFKDFGDILQVWIAKNPAGFAYVTFRNTDDAQDAVAELHGKMTDYAEQGGLRVETAQAKKSKKGGDKGKGKGKSFDEGGRDSYFADPMEGKGSGRGARGGRGRGGGRGDDDRDSGRGGGRSGRDDRRGGDSRDRSRGRRNERDADSVDRYTRASEKFGMARGELKELVRQAVQDEIEKLLEAGRIQISR